MSFLSKEVGRRPIESKQLVSGYDDYTGAHIAAKCSICKEDVKKTYCYRHNVQPRIRKHKRKEIDLQNRNTACEDTEDC